MVIMFSSTSDITGAVFGRKKRFLGDTGFWDDFLFVAECMGREGFPSEYSGFLRLTPFVVCGLLNLCWVERNLRGSDAVPTRRRFL